jgi:hypothetical protein
MLRILERMELQTGCNTSRISFATQGGGAWPVWDRYLAVDGKRAYHLGNVCQTCAFLFQRLDGANSSVEVENTSEALRAGVNDLTHRVVQQIGSQLPEGEYTACLIEADLELVVPGEDRDFFVSEQVALYGINSFYDLPHDPRISYYRVGKRSIGDHAELYHFVVPMFPESWLKAEVIAKYTKQFEEGGHSTAIAIALLDVKGPPDWDENSGPIHEHWTLTHFLIDGHHKAAAARRLGVPLRLLSFIAVGQGVSERAQLETAVEM